MLSFFQLGSAVEQPKQAIPVIAVVKDEFAISQAFLFVDKQLVCEILEPEITKFLKLWICAHCTFNMQYGKQTIPIAHVLEDCVLKEFDALIQQQMHWKRVLGGSKVETLYA